MNRKNPFKIIQSTVYDLKNYQKMSKNYKFNDVSYSSISQIYFSFSTLPIIKYKICHGFDELIEIDITNKINHILFLMILMN